MLRRSTDCTLDCSFCLRKEGKSEGLDCVTIVFEPVSVRNVSNASARRALMDRVPTLVPSAAALAFQQVFFCALGCGKQVPAVSAEDQGPDCGHGCVMRVSGAGGSPNREAVKRVEIIWLGLQAGRSGSGIVETAGASRCWVLRTWHGKTEYLGKAQVPLLPENPMTGQGRPARAHSPLPLRRRPGRRTQGCSFLPRH